MTTSPDADKPVAELSFEEASAELDTIITELDSGDVSIDALAERTERAAALVDHLKSKLTETKVRIEKVAPRLVRDPAAGA